MALQPTFHNRTRHPAVPAIKTMCWQIRKKKKFYFGAEDPVHKDALTFESNFNNSNHAHKHSARIKCSSFKSSFYFQINLKEEEGKYGINPRLKVSIEHHMFWSFHLLF